MTDAQGISLNEQGKYDAYSYLTKNKGKHTIKMSGKKHSEVKFCAYDFE